MANKFAKSLSVSASVLLVLAFLVSASVSVLLVSVSVLQLLSYSLANPSSTLLSLGCCSDHSSRSWLLT